MHNRFKIINKKRNLLMNTLQFKMTGKKQFRINNNNYNSITSKIMKKTKIKINLKEGNINHNIKTVMGRRN